MRTSQLFFPTLREVPADAEIISHQLMLRAGLIRSLGSGLYTWLPLGLRILSKIEAIVRDELSAINAQEIRMPCVQPAELWQTSNRWEKFGDQLLKIQDRHQRDFCFGPTHEEVVTNLISNEVHSYKQLPMTIYQITTKFRDEIRPRFGVMRSREFIMKDAYSFHLDETCLENTYTQMHQAYSNVFTRLGLNFRAVLADTGAIGGKMSHEFQVLAESGEDTIVYSDGSDYAANIEHASPLITETKTPSEQHELTKVATPGQYTIADVCAALELSATDAVKTLIVKGAESEFVALCLRGDHELNPLKAEKLAGVATPFEFATDAEINQIFNCNPGSLGPVKCPIPLIVDHSAHQLADFCCGANENDFHFCSANWQRDCGEISIADLRNVVAGEPSPDGKGTLHFAKGIEVGHIFQVGSGYSESLQATVLDQQGKKAYPIMGCYGMGITRIVAAAIEQNHDEHGICWPLALAPFTVAIIPIQYHKSETVKTACDKLYQELQQAGIEVLLDDRKERPGVMFTDMDLIGIPYRITIGEKNLLEGQVEYKARLTDATPLLQPLNRIAALIQQKLDE